MAECVAHCSWQAKTYVGNILVGKRFIDHRGPFHVTCLATGDCFKGTLTAPMFGASSRMVCSA